MTSPSVYNCTSTVKRHTWMDFSKLVLHLTTKHPLPNSYIIPNVILCTNSTLYKFYILIFHFIPAVIIDTFLWIAQKKFRLLKLYKFQERVQMAAQPFIKGQWDVTWENFDSLSEKLNDTDAEIFNVDMKDFDIEKCISSVYTGCPQYRVNGKPYKGTLTSYILRYFLTYLYKCFQFGSSAVLCYFAFMFCQVFMHTISKIFL